MFGTVVRRPDFLLFEAYVRPFCTYLNLTYRYCAVVSKNKMKNFFKSVAGDFSRWNTKMLCRAGVIAALYVAVTWALGELAYGPFQIRPAEALTILPLFFPESVPALYIGCILANALSLYGINDVFLGSLATLFAAAATYLVGKAINNHVLRVAVGGIFPVIFNAFIVPAVWLITDPTMTTYWYSFGSMVLTQSVWVYGLGAPLYFAISKLRKRGVKVFTSPVHAAGNAGTDGKGDSRT